MCLSGRPKVDSINATISTEVELKSLEFSSLEILLVTIDLESSQPIVTKHGLWDSDQVNVMFPVETAAGIRDQIWLVVGFMGMCFGAAAVANRIEMLNLAGDGQSANDTSEMILPKRLARVRSLVQGPESNL